MVDYMETKTVTNPINTPIQWRRNMSDESLGGLFDPTGRRIREGEIEHYINATEAALREFSLRLPQYLALDDLRRVRCLLDEVGLLREAE